ncbi:MAG: hypothetical protein KKF26_03885 [Chloroflexi bacterium]|nr:hypothetical protein [Chloroflexota bacterium]
MDFFQSIPAARIIFILAIVNLLSGALILLSCRCIPGLKISGNLMRNRVYQKFFHLHCYIWWVFWPSVLVHAVLALALIGIPF